MLRYPQLVAAVLLTLLAAPVSAGASLSAAPAARAATRVRRASVDALVRCLKRDEAAASAPTAEKALKLALRAAQAEAMLDGGGALGEAERAAIADAALSVAALRGRYDYWLGNALGSLAAGSAVPTGPALPLSAAGELCIPTAARAECLLALRAAEAAFAMAGARCESAAEARVAAAEAAREWLGDAALALFDSASLLDSSAEVQAGVRLACSEALVRELENGAWPDEPVDRLCAQHSLPRWLLQHWLESEPIAGLGVGALPDRLQSPGAQQLGALQLSVLEALASSQNYRASLTLRANTLVCSRQQLLDSLAADGVRALPSSLSAWGVLLPDGRPATERGGGLQNLRAWAAGMCEAQDEGSQLIALATAAARGECVLDLCAGNGGKTLALAAMMLGAPGTTNTGAGASPFEASRAREQPDSLVGTPDSIVPLAESAGLLVAYDIVGARLQQLQGRLTRACVPPGLVHIVKDGAELIALARGMPNGGFDCVLVDAPCSQLTKRLENTREVASAFERRFEQAEPLPFEAGEDGEAKGGMPPPLDDLQLCARAGGGSEGAGAGVDAREVTNSAHRGGREQRPSGRRERPAHFRWLLPHVHGTDGFFIARWRRRDS
ncbi:S-adenosyl-L-methionine-dependent methyltransferase [Pavlovales sp. CCMP2436]|nr:S-adenosyl-L-methionine-dependent methyltransferase [Pavlovales sp. CCMP2436]